MPSWFAVSLSRWVELESGLELVASLRGGREAIEQLEKANPDVVILDVDMPDTDGITALPHLLAKKRDLVVIMASTLTRHNAEISLRALALGAADYITKPGTTREVTVSMSFRRELMEKIRVLGGRRRRSIGARTGPRGAPTDGRRGSGLGAAPNLRPVIFRRRATDIAEVQLRPFPLVQPRVLLIGASTGGPQALNALLGCLGGVIDARAGSDRPAHAADVHHHLRRASVRGRAAGLRCEAGAWGAGAGRPNLYRARRAPHAGGRAVRATRRSRSMTARWSISASLRSIRCSPPQPRSGETSASRSCSPAWAPTATRGAADVVAAGGAVIAQDEATSVVWGMPGSVAHAGLCSAVLPLDQIAPQVIRLFSGRRQ